jgi:hypothetical protein
MCAVGFNKRPVPHVLWLYVCYGFQQASCSSRALALMLCCVLVVLERLTSALEEKTQQYVVNCVRIEEHQAHLVSAAENLVGEGRWSR